jgi:excisionase family DNA binding protein
MPKASSIDQRIQRLALLQALPFLTLYELAEYLGKTDRTIYNWKMAGVIPHIKVRGALLFERLKVEAALRKFERKEVTA